MALAHYEPMDFPNSLIRVTITIPRIDKRKTTTKVQ